MKGEVYLFAHDYTFASSEVKDLLLDPTGYTPPPQTEPGLAMLVPDISASAGPLLIELFSGTVVSANGVEQVSTPQDYRAAGPAAMKIYLGPTITTLGTARGELLVPATSIGLNQRGQTLESDEPLTLDISQKYLIRLTNENGAGTRVGLKFAWAER
jgi:hypothetical protein